MESIYKTFWGSYIDLARINYINSFEYPVDSYKGLKIYISFQLMEKPVVAEVDWNDMDIDHDNNVGYMDGREVRFSSTTQFTDINGEIISCDSMETMRMCMSFDYIKRFYEELIEHWKKYKNDKEKST